MFASAFPYFEADAELGVIVAFGFNIDLLTLGAIANAANRQEEGDVNDEQQDCGEKQVNLLRQRLLEKN